MHPVIHLPLFWVHSGFHATQKKKTDSSADRVNQKVSCKIFCMYLWTRLRLSASKKLKSRALVFSLYTTAFSVVLAPKPVGTSPQESQGNKCFLRARL